MRIRTVFITSVLIVVSMAAIIAVITQPLVVPISSTPPQVDPTRLEGHVKHLSVDLYPRSFDQFHNIEMSAQYILNELKASGAAVTIQNITVQETIYKNIIARFGPESGPSLIIGAHYDSYGNTSTDTKLPVGYTVATHTPGADDNASGVAGLLELSRLLGRSHQTRPIELVAYALEEPPHFRTRHMGSVRHAQSLKAAKRNVVLMLSLEMIGYFNNEPGSQSYSLPVMANFYPDRGDFIALVGKLSDFKGIRRVKALMSGATDLPVYSINAPRFVQGVDFSDHQSFWNEGFPAIMVTDTAFLRNTNYHQADDTYEKLDYRRMAKVVQSVYAIIQQY